MSKFMRQYIYICKENIPSQYMSGRMSIIHVTIAVSIHVRPNYDNYVRMYVPECLSEECLA